VSKELEFFPKYLQHRNKQRLTKIHQYLIRMRKLKLKTNKCVRGLTVHVCVCGWAHKARKGCPAPTLFLPGLSSGCDLPN